MLWFLYERLLGVAINCSFEDVYNENCLCFSLNQAARDRGVDCVVAPYEADAQLAYLTKSGLAQAVITEDSDLLAFGCKTVPNKWNSLLQIIQTLKIDDLHENIICDCKNKEAVEDGYNDGHLPINKKQILLFEA